MFPFLVFLQIMAVIAEDGPKYLYEGEFTVEGIKVSVSIEISHIAADF